jgi:hypothetical protein
MFLGIRKLKKKQRGQSYQLRGIANHPPPQKKRPRNCRRSLIVSRTAKNLAFFLAQNNSKRYFPINMAQI